MRQKMPSSSASCRALCAATSDFDLADLCNRLSKYHVQVDAASCLNHKDSINGSFNLVIGENGICIDNICFLVSCLSRLLGGSPVQRVHAWLRKARRDSVASPEPRSESVGPFQILCTHLQFSPVASVSPKRSRCRKRWLSRDGAWQVTEWLVALLTYYALGCPMSTAQLARALGSWHVSTNQNTAFEGTTYFCGSQPSEDWSRGRKTSYDTLISFHSNSVVAGDVASCIKVVAKQVHTKHISLPSTAGILDPCAALCPDAKRFSET